MQSPQQNSLVISSPWPFISQSSHFLYYAWASYCLAWITDPVYFLRSTWRQVCHHPTPLEEHYLLKTPFWLTSLLKIHQRFFIAFSIKSTILTLDLDLALFSIISLWFLLWILGASHSEELLMQTLACHPCDMLYFWPRNLLPLFLSL